jgi:hypothetical protein
MKLPIELREKSYESLFDSTLPRTVPQHESEDNPGHWSVRAGGSDATDIFHNEYIFDEKVMACQSVNRSSINS